MLRIFSGRVTRDIPTTITTTEIGELGMTRFPETVYRLFSLYFVNLTTGRSSSLHLRNVHVLLNLTFYCTLNTG